MRARKLRRVVIALVLAAGVLLLPAAAQAGRLRHRGLDEVARQVRERGLLDSLVLLLRRMAQPSGGGMDPNGLD